MMADKKRNALQQTAQELYDIAGVIKERSDDGPSDRYKQLIAQGLALLLIEIRQIGTGVAVGLGLLIGLLILH